MVKLIIPGATMDRFTELLLGFFALVSISIVCLGCYFHNYDLLAYGKDLSAGFVMSLAVALKINSGPPTKPA